MSDYQEEDKVKRKQELTAEYEARMEAKKEEKASREAEAEEDEDDEEGERQCIMSLILLWIEHCPDYQYSHFGFFRTFYM